MDLYAEIHAILRQIPKGNVTSYREVARALGDESMARAVANLIKNFPHSHRVVSSDGRVGEGKVKLLIQEGVQIKKGRIDLRNYFFKEFAATHPLKRLREEQILLRERVCTKDDFKKIEIIGGMDVAYTGEIGYGAYVEMDMKGNILKEKAVKKKITFPYMPSYLAYRELPILNALIKKEKPSLVMIDGNGILHPYKFGLASHFGVANNIVSIGIAKKLLCGKVRRRYVYIGNERVGISYKKSGKPIYVSPGHKISLESAFIITKKMCAYRIPEPLRKAHLLATKAREIDLQKS